jgi:hypothetical protein
MLAGATITDGRGGRRSGFWRLPDKEGGLAMRKDGFADRGVFTPSG